MHSSQGEDSEASTELTQEPRLSDDKLWAVNSIPSGQNSYGGAEPHTAWIQLVATLLKERETVQSLSLK